MFQVKQNNTIQTKAFDISWKGLYKLGGIVALMVITIMILDIMITFIPGWDATVDSHGAADWFELFQENPLLGLRNLDLLNLIIAILSIPVFCALFAAHLPSQKGYGLLALMLFMAGSIIFVVNNAALPMLTLSSKYAAASETQKLFLAAAGDAILVRGEHGSPGAFLGFALTTIANLVMAYVILKGNVFSKRIGYVGFGAFMFLLIYTVIITFISKSSTIIMVFAMPGGILALVYNILVAKKLLKLGC